MEEEESSIALGKEMFEKSLRKLNNLKLLDELNDHPEVMGFNNSNIIYSNIAKGKISIKDIVNKYDDSIEDIEHINEFKSESLTERFINKARGVSKGVKVGGISNAMIYFPKCCSPIPGDEIVGYITKGRGVTIHRLECKNIPLTKFSDRFIEVEWDFAKNTSFLIRLKIEIEDRKHLLKDLTESTSSMNINIKSVDISAEDGVAACLMIIEIVDIKQLNRLKNRIIKNIKPISIERM